MELLSEYKIPPEVPSLAASACTSPNTDDLLSNLTEAKPLQQLNIYPRYNNINFEDRFFEYLKNTILNNEFLANLSAYTNSDFISDLISKLESEECTHHSDILEIIYHLSNYNEVLEFLKDPEVIDLLYRIASNAETIPSNNNNAIKILTRVLPLVVNSETYLTNHPIEEFDSLREPDEVIPLFSKLIEIHPNREEFRSILKFIYNKTKFQYSKEIVMILKNVIPIYPEEINFLFELKKPKEPDFLNKLLSHVFCEVDEEEDDLRNMTGLMEAFRVPLISNIDINKNLFLIINETHMAYNSYRYFMHFMCDNSYRLSAIRFFEACFSHDAIRKEAILAVHKCEYMCIVYMASSAEFEIKKSLLGIITNYIKFQGFDAAEKAIKQPIFQLIDSFIPDYIQLVLNALNAIIEKFVERNKGKIIYDLIKQTSVIEDLEETADTTDNDEEYEMITNRSDSTLKKLSLSFLFMIFGIVILSSI